MQAVRTCLACYGNLIEKGALKKYISRGRRYAAVLTPHHTRNSQRTVMICNHQCVTAQGHFLAIKQDQLFALFRHTDTNTAVDFGEIKCMKRLPQLQHHIIGDVDRSVDAAHIGAAQALHHPQGCRAG